jgi:uncharacterized RDD family membrane protein YckC
MHEFDRVTAVVVLGVLAAVDGAGHATPEASGVAERFGRFAETVRGRMLDVVDPDDIVDRVDINAVMERVDIDAVLARTDINALITRIDIDALLTQVDIDAVLARTDINALITRIDIDALLTQVDIDAVLARTDINALITRVNIDALMERVDLNRLLDGVDPDRLLARVDIDALMERVDLEMVVQRAGIPDIVAESTGSVLGSALDLLRRQLLALDVVIMRAVMRLRGRDAASAPAGPTHLVGSGGPDHALPAPNAPVADVAGHYAGPVTRLTAYLLDAVIATSLFALANGAVTSLLRAFGFTIAGSHGLVYVSALILWLFFYWYAGTAIAGRTSGMTIVGLRIVQRDGDPLTGRQPLVRVLVLPLSIVTVIGLAGIVLDGEHRALHDLAAGSTVVYDWGDRRATLPTPLARWLAEHAAPIEP